MDLLQKTEIAALIIETACRIYAPKDTGNLSMNGIRSVYENGMWQVVIGGEVAPYAVETNEVWEKGKNPNEGWVENAINSVKQSIVGVFQDKYTEEDLINYQSKLTKLANETLKVRSKGVIDFGI